MRYLISAEDLIRLMLLASHLDIDDEIGGILMRVSKNAMEQPGTGPAQADNQAAPFPPAKPE